MSDDLISRQAAIFAILEYCGSDFADEYECGYDDGLRKAVHKLKHLPSAQPERKKGKWVLIGSRLASRPYACSECNYAFQVDTVMGKTAWNFCPNCGAEMENGRRVG